MKAREIVDKLLEDGETWENLIGIIQSHGSDIDQFDEEDDTDAFAFAHLASGLSSSDGPDNCLEAAETLASTDLAGLSGLDQHAVKSIIDAANGVINILKKPGQVKTQTPYDRYKIAKSKGETNDSFSGWLDKQKL